MSLFFFRSSFTSCCSQTGLDVFYPSAVERVSIIRKLLEASFEQSETSPQVQFLNSLLSSLTTMSTLSSFLGSLEREDSENVCLALFLVLNSLMSDIITGNYAIA